jgi:hypothetical protein
MFPDVYVCTHLAPYILNNIYKKASLKFVTFGYMLALPCISVGVKAVQIVLKLYETRGKYT